MNYFKLLVIIFIFKTVTAQELIVYNENNSPIIANKLSSLAIDSLNNIWVGDGNSLYKFDRDWSIDLAEFDQYFVYDIAVSPNNTIWLCTNSGLVDHQVNKIFFYNGNIWDTVIYDFGFFDPIDISVKNDTTIYFALRNNWPNQLGDDEIGIYQNNVFSVLNPDNLWGISSATPLNGDSLLAVDWYGINLFNGTNWTLQNPVGWRPKAIEKIGNEIYAIGESLGKYESGNYLSFPLVDTLLMNDSAAITALAIESNQTLWLGTDKGKLIKYNNSGIETFNLTNELISDIAIDRNGNKWFLSNEGCFEFNEDQIVEVENEPEIPKKYSLAQNYPNPFNPTTTIKYTIPAVETGLPAYRQAGIPSLLQLKIYDVLGKEVAVLVNQKQKPGNYQITFSANNLPSGIYFYRILSKNYSETKKMILLR